MALPEFVRRAALRKVVGYCEGRVPHDALEEVRVEARPRGDAITIIEVRAPWCAEVGPASTESKVAQVRYDRPTRTWELFRL